MLFFAPVVGLLILDTFTTCISVQFPPVQERSKSGNGNGNGTQDEEHTKSSDRMRDGGDQHPKSSDRGRDGDRSSRALLHHNYIITSRPYQLINSSGPDPNSKWRRELYVTTTLGTTNGFEPASDSSGSDCSSPNAAQSCHNLIKQDDIDGPTFRPYSTAELEKILKEYNLNREKNITASDRDSLHSKLSNSIEPLYGSATTTLLSSTSGSIDSILTDKSKSWNHAANPQKNPYDDRQGWVTLEPVAWSSSQVQKWEPNPNRPTWPVPSEVTGGQWSGPSPTTPHFSEHGGGGGGGGGSSWTTDRPWNKPTYQYGGGGGGGGGSSISRPPIIQSSHYTPVSSGHLHFANTKPDIYGPPHGGGGWGGGGGGSSHPDIITAGRPDFPPDEPSQPAPWGSAQSSYGVPKPAHTQVVYQGPISAHEKPSYSAEGEGHWVLLSSTKGYSVPQRHRNMARSIRFDDDGEESHIDLEESKKPEMRTTRSAASTRSVRLEVLPPTDKDTQIIHGGMIEVEKTHQTVDEAHREHLARSLKFPSEDRKPTGNSSIQRVRRPELRRASARMDTGVTSRDTSTRDMTLAAVGAGVIPATMAMILPVILARKKRGTHTSDQRSNRGTIAIVPASYRMSDVTRERRLNQRILPVY